MSAPTLESAVAAAAMAQDEMGHARSTYPVLKALGAEAGDEGLEGRGRRLVLLDDELPDWMAFIAANLLIDGVLTTFVASCVDSSVDPDGPAREEDPPGGGLAPGARRGVGRRLCRAGGGQRDALVARCWRRGSTPGAGWARTTTPASPPRSPGMIKRGPAAQREQVRAWLVDLLAGEGVTITLDGAGRLVALGPAGGGTAVSVPTCPFCGAGDVERVGQWGGQIITAQWRCQACNSYFEAVREDFDEPVPADPREDPDAGVTAAAEVFAPPRIVLERGAGARSCCAHRAARRRRAEHGAPLPRRAPRRIPTACCAAAAPARRGRGWETVTWARRGPAPTASPRPCSSTASAPSGR